jgi:hypothetical protein
VRSLDRVQWQQWMRWVRARPWPVWAAAGSVFVLFAVLGAVTRGPAPVPVAAHSLADGIERATAGPPAASPTAAATGQPRYPGVAYPTVPVSPVPSTVTPTAVASASGYYGSCAAAEAAGAAPLRRGRPGYRPELDRDGDGVACDATPTSPAAPAVTPSSPGPTVPSPTPDPTPTETVTPTPTPSPTAADPSGVA